MLSWLKQMWQERILLRSCRNYRGFAIYRTIYTLESDLLWEGAIVMLDGYVLNSIWGYIRIKNHEVGEGENQLDPEPTRKVSR